MKILKRVEKGFTLIELLIVVAILGVLAAVIIPNVGRFIGAGESESAATELANVQTAVVSMMVDNTLSVLPNPVLIATSDMAAFPDTSTTAAAGAGDKDKDPNGNDYELLDKDGYLLYTHDIIGDADAATGLVNYVAAAATKGTYTVMLLER